MNRYVRFAKNPWLLAAVGTVLIYSLAGFLLIPYLVRHYTPKIVADQIEREAAIGDVHFNPFLFSFEANDFSLKEPGGQPILGLRRLFVDFELESLFRRAWTFKELSLEGLSLEVVKDREGKLNLSKIADSLPPAAEPSPPPTPGPPPRLLLKHLALKDSSVQYTDQSADGAVETLSPIDVTLESLSTLPDSRSGYSLNAKLAGGGSVGGRGNFTLEPIHAEGELTLDDFSLGIPWKFLRARLNIAEPQGVASLSAQYRMDQNPTKTDFVLDNFAFGITKLRLTLVDAAEPLLTLDKIQLAKARLDLTGRSVKLPSFLIENGQIEIAADAQGSVNWQSVVKPQPASAQPATAPTPQTPASPAETTPWRMALDAFKLNNIGIRYTDSSRRIPYVASVGSLGLELGAEAEVGSVEPKAHVNGLKLALSKIVLNEEGKARPLVGLEGLEVDDGQLDLEKREVLVQKIALNGGGMDLLRDKDGAIRLTEVFAPKGEASTAPSPTDATQSSPPSPPWHFKVDNFALDGFHLGLVDSTFSPEIAYDLDNIAIGLNHLANDDHTPVAFEVKFQLKQGGSFVSSGSAALTGANVEAKIQADRLNLAPLQPAVAQFTTLKLNKADVSTQLQANYKQTETGPAVKLAGTFGMGELLFNEAVGGKRFLSWKNLLATGIDFSLKPDRLSVKDVRIQELGSKIAIAEDHTANLTTIFKTQSKKTSAKTGEQQGQPKAHKTKAASPAAKPEKTAAQPAQKAFPVTVERVRVEDGVVDFSDMSLVIPFATRIHDFDGTVTDISTAPATRTHLDFVGRVEEFGEAKVAGTLSPTEIKSYSDIKVIFRNVEMTSLSPYSATFAGRKIKSGKLSLDLLYNIENSHLKSENKILLDQFTLGEQVESPNAVSLPLDLAIALLTDGEGKINATVPIEGDVDNPQFGYGKLIWNAVVTLVQKAVTAPFRALGSVFGGGEEEDFGAVLFEPGHDAVPPPEREKLQKVVKALTQRPKVKLTVHGGYDPKEDAAALKTLHIRQAVAKEMDRSVEAGADPGPLPFTSAKIQRALESLANQRVGAQTLDALQSDFEKSTGRKPKRVGAVASMLGQASEDQDFYEKVFRQLVEMEPLQTRELEALGEARSKAVLTELSKQPGFDSARVGSGKIESGSSNQDRKVPTALELGILE